MRKKIILSLLLLILALHNSLYSISYLSPPSANIIFQDNDYDELKKIISSNIRWWKAFYEKIPLFLSGIDDFSAEKLLRESEEEHKKNMISSFTDLVIEYNNLGIKLMDKLLEYDTILIYGYYPKKDNLYSTDDCLKVLSTLRALKGERETRSQDWPVIIVISNSEYDSSVFSSKQKSSRAFPLYNFQVFYHFNGSELVEYSPRYQEFEPLKFPDTSSIEESL